MNGVVACVCVCLRVSIIKSMGLNRRRWIKCNIYLYQYISVRYSSLIFDFSLELVFVHFRWRNTNWSDCIFLCLDMCFPNSTNSLLSCNEFSLSRHSYFVFCLCLNSQLSLSLSRSLLSLGHSYMVIFIHFSYA